MAIADPETIAKLDTYKGYLRALTDPRKTTEAQAQQLLGTAKPIYYITSGMHSPETGGPEMLMELAYRLAVEAGELQVEHLDGAQRRVVRRERGGARLGPGLLQRARPELVEVGRFGPLRSVLAEPFEWPVHQHVVLPSRARCRRQLRRVGTGRARPPGPTRARPRRWEIAGTTGSTST